MKTLLIFITAIFLSATPALQAQTSASKPNSEKFADLLNTYYEESMKLFPLNATVNGDNRYNNLLYVDFTDSFRNANLQMNQRTLKKLQTYEHNTLNANDQISYDILMREVSMNIEAMKIKDNLLVYNQMGGIPLDLAQLGSGNVVQPFASVQDYDNWMRRASVFPAWIDSAIVYFQKGIAQNLVLPKVAVEKMIPQIEELIVADPKQSVFYGPINKLPKGFSDTQKTRLTQAYTKLIAEQLNPAYKRLSAFLKDNYLPKARTTSGWNALPEGAKMYNFYIRYFTTTNKTPEELFNTGLAEVNRLRLEMEKVRQQIGYKGDLKSLFDYTRTDAKFFPYKTPEEVLIGYRSVLKNIEPNLKKMFGHTPKTAFEIRQTEAFRAASAAPQYYPGSSESNRPGIFYVPIVNATKTSLNENIFLHEAIPGHHFQVMLQNENKELPKFRRYGGNAAYGEGWGLYAESLGKELGCYSDPYQYLLALGGDIHRAVRLVVDVGLHAKGWAREKAIQYMLDNEPISEQFATAEIERYMVVPGQALAYKTGALKIKELRDRYTKQLGKAFSLAAFHDELLKDGAMPLDVLERKMDAWAKRQKSSI